jgi:hypothetical protein
MTCIIGMIPLLSDVAVYIFVEDLDLYAEPNANSSQDNADDNDNAEEEAETRF